MWWWDGWSGWWPLMTFGMLVVWAVLAWVIVAAIRGGQRTEESRRPEQILAERFAHGEIDEAEYQQRLVALRASVNSR
jgi:putative membrane protein